MAINKKLFIKSDTGITPSENFGISTWSGDGSSDRTIATGFNMTTGGFTWLKKRSGTGGKDHILSHTLDGTADPFFLYPNLNLQQFASGSNNQIQDFVSTGFTVNASAYTNASGSTYVAWSWSMPTSFSHSASGGQLASSGNSNQSAGFSILTYTGNNSSGATVKHNLSSTPELIIVKRRDAAGDWDVFTSETGATKYLILDTNQAQLTASNIWNNTAPTSSVFTIGNHDSVNANSGTYLAFCFHSVAGFSKIGTYEGNNPSAVTVSLDFTPRFVLIKNIDNAANWYIFDTGRDTSNPRTKGIYPDLDDLENTNTGTGNKIDINTNEFVINGGGGDGTNMNGSTFIYYAIA